MRKYLSICVLMMAGLSMVQFIVSAAEFRGRIGDIVAAGFLWLAEWSKPWR